MNYAQNLTLEEVLEKTKKYNFTMEKQDLLIENNIIGTKAHYKRRFLPSVNFGAEGDLSEIKDKGVGPERVSMKIDLDIGRQGLNEYKIKKNALEIAYLNKDKTWYQLQEDVISTYFEYLSINKRLGYIEKTLDVLKKQQQKLYRMLKGGNLIPKNELLKIEIDIEENNYEALTDKFKKERLKQKLYTLMGMELDQDIEFKEFSMMSLEIKDNFDDFETLEKKALKESIEAKVMKLEMENTIYTNKIAKAELLPKFYIKPEYLFDDSGYDKKGERVTFGFSWNFQWGATLDNIEASNNSLKISEMSQKESVANHRLNLRAKFEELKMAKLRLEISNKKINLMRENLKLDTSRFENRLMGSTEYLSSIKSLKEAEELLYEQNQKILMLCLELQNMIS